MTEPKDPIQSKPPYFKNWSSVYWIVVGTLVAFVLLMSLFTYFYS